MLSTDLFYLLVFLTLGAVWYNVDRAYGASLYAWWYATTHKEKLPEGVKLGFIYQRKAKPRFFAAIYIGLAEYLLLSHWMVFGPLNKVTLLFTGIVATMTGFYCGPLLHSLWSRKDTVLDKIDQVESGQVDLTQEAKEAAEKIRQGAKETLSDAVARVGEGIAKAAEEVAEHLPLGSLGSPPEPPEEATAETPPAQTPNSAEILEQLMGDASQGEPQAARTELPQEEPAADKPEDPAEKARRELKEFASGRP